MNPNIFKMKALDFAKSLGSDDFLASDRWLGWCKKHFNVNFKAISGKYTSTMSLEVVVPKRLWNSLHLKKKLTWDLHFFPISLIYNFASDFQLTNVTVTDSYKTVLANLPVFPFRRYLTRQSFFIMTAAKRC